MNTADILIIGAGATGLMAARTLTKAGKKVIVLEARERTGGRIHTLKNELFFNNTELGAEFVHGNLPVTLNLLNEAGIAYHAAGGEMWHYLNGTFSQEGEMEGWDLLMEKLKRQQIDLSIDEFLTNEFTGEQYENLKRSVRKFVAGYDTANPLDASTFALRSEWENEDEDAQHRVTEGYGSMIKYLEDECLSQNGKVYLNSIVRQIRWSAGCIKATTDDGSIYNAQQLVTAIPLGVLKAAEGETGALIFDPPIPKQKQAFADLGFGAIVKILIEFDEPFWESEAISRLAGTDLKNMGFLLSDEAIPTWWTQAPQHSAVLTGWLGGPPAIQKIGLSDDELLQLSISSLSNIFKIDEQVLKGRIMAFDIVNWTKDPFARGSYAYDTVATPDARRLLNEPVENTLFFAGEYLYEGPSMGTVEAALTSGLKIAEKMLKLWRF